MVKKSRQGLNVEYRLKGAEEVNRMELSIVNHRDIPSIAPFDVGVRWGKKVLTAKISNEYIPLQTLLLYPISLHTFINVISTILQTMLSCEAYGINLKNLVSDERYIFYSLTSKKIMMIYLPVISTVWDNEKDSKQFFLSVAHAARFSMSTDQQFLNKYFRFLSERKKFDAAEMNIMMEQLKQEYLWKEKKNV